MSTLLQPPPVIDSFPQRIPDLPNPASFQGGHCKAWTFPEHAFNVLSSPASRPYQVPQDSPVHQTFRLPALATLASIASQYQPIVEVGRTLRSDLPANFHDRSGDIKLEPKRHSDNCDLISSCVRTNMSYATVAPGQSAGLANGVPPVCGNCQTSTTPLWRRDEDGNVLCNACGLFLKLHGRPRPISLKTNIIKSRNRVRASASSGQQGQQGPQPKKKKSLPAAGGTSQFEPTASIQQHGLPEEYQSPKSHISNLYAPSNIAPQHVFDSITLDAANQQSLANLYNSGYAPQRNGSPSGSLLLNGIGDSQNGHGDGAQLPNDLVAANNHLKTRVSELEVINNLFRERVAELEGGEGETKRALEDALRKIKDLEARVVELEGGAPNDEIDGEGRESKRRRLSHSLDEGDGSASGS